MLHIVRVVKQRTVNDQEIVLALLTTVHILQFGTVDLTLARPYCIRAAWKPIGLRVSPEAYNRRSRILAALSLDRSFPQSRCIANKVSKVKMLTTKMTTIKTPFTNAIGSRPSLVERRSSKSSNIAHAIFEAMTPFRITSAMIWEF